MTMLLMYDSSQTTSESEVEDADMRTKCLSVLQI